MIFPRCSRSAINCAYISEKIANFVQVLASSQAKKILSMGVPGQDFENHKFADLAQSEERVSTIMSRKLRAVYKAFFLDA